MSHTSRIASLVAFAGLAGGLAQSAHAQTTTWIGPPSGVWSTAANWDNGFPLFGVGTIINTVTTTTANGDFSTGDLTLGLLGAIVHVPSGNVLTVHGTSVVNNGEILINPFNGGNDAYLYFNAPVCTISGTGSIVLDPVGTQLAVDATIQTGTATNVVVNSAGHTIKGNGYIGAGLSNFGLITADSAARQLNIYGNPKANAADIVASNGGRIHLSSCPITQSSTGVIRATGAGSYAFIGSGVCSLTGGTWEGVNGGVAQTGGDVTLDNVTTNGTVNVWSGEAATILNDLNNTGTLTVNPSGGSNDAYLSFNSPATTLSGGGTIVLNPVGGSSGADAGIISGAPGNIVTNPAGATIRGNGYINTNINNAGLITADIAARGISLVVNPKSNSGLMLAQNGGMLDIHGIAISQSGSGTIRAEAGSLVEVHGNVTGGVLGSTGNGVVRTGGALTLDSVTTNGTVNVTSGTTATILNALTNTGTLTVNPSGGSGDAYLSFDSPATTLNGGGTIILNPIGGTSGADAGILSNVATNIVTNPAGATIRGNGYINANINNQGLLAADIAARGIALVINPKSNSGLMLAQNGGMLDIHGIAITQTSGGVTRADGASSLVEVHGTFSGGTLESINGGLVRTGGDLTLTGTTIGGSMHVQSGNTLNIPASLTNNGAITVNPTGGSTNANVVIQNSLTLSGTGTVVFNGVGSLNDANIAGTAGVTLTNAAGHTIAGNGELNVTLTNDGILSPGKPITGDQTQELRRNSDLTCSGSSVVRIDIEGSAAAQFDRLTGGNNSSDFVCAGALNVSHINGYTGSPIGTTFDIITAIAPATITGTFASVSTPLMPGGNHYMVEYLPTAVRLRVVCPVDIDDDGTFPGANPSGGVDINDLLFFLAAFEAGSLSADLDDGTNSGNPDGGVDIGDLLFFLAHFEAGC